MENKIGKKKGQKNWLKRSHRISHLSKQEKKWRKMKNEAGHR